MNNIKVDDTKDIDLVMLRYNSKEYSHNYLKTFGSLWQHYRDKPALDDINVSIDFPANDNNNSISYRFKEKITE